MTLSSRLSSASPPPRPPLVSSHSRHAIPISLPTQSGLGTDPFLVGPTSQATYTYKVTVESAATEPNDRMTTSNPGFHLTQALKMLDANIKWTDHFQEVIAYLRQWQRDKALETLGTLGWNGNLSKFLIDAMVQDLLE